MKHVLIVDDDYDICEALQLILEDQYRVLVAYNGEQALEVLAREHVDGIVLDLMMPLMDGETLMRVMRERNIAVPVILASAATHLSSRARTAGAAGYLQKPFDATQLEQALSRLFSGGGAGSPLGGAGGASGPGRGHGGAESPIARGRAWRNPAGECNEPLH